MSSYSVEFRLVFIIFTISGLIPDAHGHFCPKGWIYRPGSNSCYLITTTIRRPWPEAQLACEGNEAHLLKIDDEEERNWITVQIGKVQSSDPQRPAEWWVGLNDRKKVKEWVWTDGTPVDEHAIVWNDHEPNNWGGAEWCAEIWGHGLNDKSCSIVQAYICERLKNYPFKCNNDQGWEYYNGSCYKYFSEPASWYNAQWTCEMEDSELITIQDRTVQFYANDQVSIYHKSIWIGLHFVEDEDQGTYEWKWVNGKQISLNFWKDGRFPFIKEELKNNSCAFADPNIKMVNTWVSGECPLQKPFLCQRKTGTCVDGWEQHQDSCYQFSFLYRLTYSKSKEYCQNQGGNLVDINSARDQNFINSKLKELSDAGIELFWIGLTVDPEGRTEWETGENVTFTNWPLTGKPKPSRSTKCASIRTNDTDGKWRIVNFCNGAAKAFVCKIAAGAKVKKVFRPSVHYSCSPGWFAMSKYCYKFFTETLSWIAAKDICKKYDAHLIKVSSKTAQSVLKIPTTIHNNYVWIGLNDRAEEGKMVWENDGTELDPLLTHWKPGEPDNMELHENCVASSLRPVSGYWSDFGCQTEFPFVCQRLADNILTNKTVTNKPPSENPGCGAEWEIDPTGENCYHFSDEQLNWFDAENTCRYHGGYMTSITGLHEQFYIAGRIQNMQSVALWIGTHDLFEEGLWLWNDDSPMSYFNWKTGHPDYDRTKNNCAMIVRQDSLWVDNMCYLRNGYICKKESPLKPTATMAPPPPLDDSEFTCPNTWIFYIGVCYKIITELYSWEHSLKNCHLQGGDLVSINSKSEQNFMYELLSKEQYKMFWIGLTASHHAGIFTWSNGEKVTYTNWNAWEPNNFPDEHCVLYSSRENRWNDYKCSSKEWSVCEKAAKRITKDECMNNIQSDSVCFLHMMTAKSWQNARAYCQHYLSADLVTIDSYEKQQSANQGMMPDDPPYWISPESSKGSFQNWNNDEKVDLDDGKCLAIGTGPVKKWIAIPCETTAYFICARSIDPTKNTTLSPPTVSTRLPATTVASTTSIPTVKTTETTLSCPENWLFFHNACYKEFYTNLHGINWIDALHSCQEHSGLLVSLESDEELTFLRTNVMKKNHNPYWLGGRFDVYGNITWLNSKYTVNVEHGDTPFSHYTLCPVISKWQYHIYSQHCDQAADWICKITASPRRIVVNNENFNAYCKTGSLEAGPYYNGSCYVSAFEFKKVTWHTSKAVCELYNKRLASIHSQDENDYLAMAFSARRYIWIGIHAYSMTNDNKWADSSDIDYTNWDEGEPSDIYKKPCAVLDTISGKWRTFNCYALFPALCKGKDSFEISDPHHETVLTGGCLSGFVPYGNKCFMIGGTGYHEQLNWQQAQEKCQSYGKLFGLASIQNRFEQAFLTLMMKSLNISLWIGMRKSIDYLTWVDNSPLTFFHFNTIAAEELLQYTGTNCIASHTEPYSAGLWFGSNCYELAGYICQGYRDASLPLRGKSEVVSKFGYKKYGNAEYKVIKTNKTWTEAEAFCQQEENGGGHLASISDAFENAVLRLMSKDIQEEFWIGAKEHYNKMFWSDSWPMQYTQWPVIMFKEDECGLYQDQDVWNMVECNKEYPFICKITTEEPPMVAEPPTQAGKCPENWHHIKNKCYLVKNKMRSWPDANYVCAQIGATLTSLHSADDVMSIKDIRRSVTLFPLNSIWIGLSLKSGILSWTDGSNVDFLNFMHGESSDKDHASYFSEHNISRNCFVMDFQTELWRRVSCFQKSLFLCMTDQLIPTTTTTTTDESDVCLNCTTKIPTTEKKPAISTVEIVAICLVIPVLLLVLALIPYYIIKRKTEAVSPESESFLNSVYESPNFMVMNPS